MKQPIQRINAYTVPPSGTMAHDVEQYLTGRIGQIVAGLPRDPVLEIAATPRGDYLEVMVFVGRNDVLGAVQAQVENLKTELNDRGVSSVFYVKTWSGKV